MASLYDQNLQRKYLNSVERQRFKDCAEGRRNLQKRAFLLTLIETGGRISEVLNLKVCDIDFVEYFLVFQTLKQRDNFLPRVAVIRPSLATIIQSMIAQDRLKDDDLLWTIRRETGWRWVKQVMQEADITGIKATPKGLRHSFAVGCARHGVSLPDIKTLMGHSSLKTTEIYLNVMPEELRHLIIKSLPT